MIVEIPEIADILRRLEALEKTNEKIIALLKTDVLLTQDEAEEYMKCSTMTLYRLNIDGVLPKVKIDGKNRYKKSDLDRCIDLKRAV